MSRPRTCRFVVLHHTGVDSPHFDWMIEVDPGEPLWTWRIDAWPPDATSHPQRIHDHRTIYLTYQGPLTGNRGQVARVDDGECGVERSGVHLIVHLPGRAVVSIPIEPRA